MQYNEEEFIRSKAYLEAILKGLIGRDLYDQSVYYRVVNALDPIYNAAVEIITTPAAYNSILQSPKE